MNACIRITALTVLATVSISWLSGCGGGTKDKPKTLDPHTDADHKDHKEKEQSNQKDHKDGHHDKALTEKDVKMPESFKAGVGRLEELHKNIQHLIEHKELPKVHRVAEEMALVAKRIKELARKEVSEDYQADVGRLANEIAGYFPTIDEAADAGKKAETEEIYKKMGKAIEKLKAHAK